MIRLYSTHCPKCKVLELKLKQKNIEFELVDDTDEVVKVGQEHGILGAPILEVNGDFLDFNKAVKYINEVK